MKKAGLRESWTVYVMAASTAEMSVISRVVSMVVTTVGVKAAMRVVSRAVSRVERMVV